MAADAGYKRDVRRLNEGYKGWGELKNALSNRRLEISLVLVQNNFYFFAINTNCALVVAN